MKQSTLICVSIIFIIFVEKTNSLEISNTNNINHQICQDNCLFNLLAHIRNIWMKTENKKTSLKTNCSYVRRINKDLNVNEL